MASKSCLSAELWKMVLEFTSICELRIMDFVLTEDSLEMGERANFDEEINILKYRLVSKVFADSVLEMITSISIPQDTADSRSGRLLKCLLSRPTALRVIDLTYPPDRIILPCPLDTYVWEHIAVCNNLRDLTIDQYSHLSEPDLRMLSSKCGQKILSITFCCDIANGIVNILPGLLPNLKKLELQAKSADQIVLANLSTVPDMSRFRNLQILIDADGELFRSEDSVRSVTQLPCLAELHIGQSDNFSRWPKLLLDNPFSVCLKLFALLAKDAPIQNLERLHICASYLQRGVTPSLDDALEQISKTFINLTLLSIRYASLLLSSPESIKSLSNLKCLETLDFRKCEIPVLKFTDNGEIYSNARTVSWCDEYMQYFPKTLKTLYIETDASRAQRLTQFIQADLKECMETLKTKFSTLPNLKVFSCEAFPTFSRVQCKPWFGTYCNW